MRSSRHLIGTVGLRGQPAASQLPGCHGRPAPQKDFNSVTPHLLLCTPLWRVHKRVLRFPPQWAGPNMAPASPPPADRSPWGRPAHTRPSPVCNPIPTVCVPNSTRDLPLLGNPGPSQPLQGIHTMYTIFRGFPGAANGKGPTCQCRRHKRRGFSPWVGEVPWRRPWQRTPGFLPGESQGQRSPAGYSPRGHKESDTIEGT